MENLPKKYDESVFGRLKRFLRGLFCGNKNNQIENVQIEKNKKIVDIPKSNIFDEMQNDYKKSENENYIVEQTIKNPETIKKLSGERLKQLNQLYDKRIECNKGIIFENNNKITSLQNRLDKLYDKVIEKNQSIIEENDRKIESLKNLLYQVQT